MAEPRSFRDDMGRLLERSQQERSLEAWARVEAAILRVCPEYEASWGLPYVVELVMTQRVTVQSVANALGQYKVAIARAAKGQRKPIDDRPGYLSSIFKREFARHGIPWASPWAASRRQTN